MNEFVDEVLVFEPQPEKPESWHQSTVYGVVAKPTPLSVEAVHVHSGVVSVVKEVEAGVPGVVGAVVSITTVPLEE